MMETEIMASDGAREAPFAAPDAVTVDKDWERKQRNREYRVAARREKRNRKADEKKQRKLNATILRRMTRNPDKYNKNAERNRLRDIEGERRRIWQEAVRQVQRLAAIYDPSGALFNVGPVVKLEDGTVISEETLRRREQRAQEKATAERLKTENTVDEGLAIHSAGNDTDVPLATAMPDSSQLSTSEVKPGGLTRIDAANPPKSGKALSKKQQKKRAALEPRPPPQKPTIPENIPIPDGEENWLALWDLPDEQLERRVLREKKRRAAERKALRVKQKSGKAERREARDEKRRVYREIKLTWRAIKEETTREKTKLKSLEDEESRKIAVDINIMERQAALDHCASLGFTLANTSGVDEIKPRARGMKGVEVDFNAIEVSESRTDVKPKQSSKRVDLSNVPKDTKAAYIPSGQRGDGGDLEEFIKFDAGEEHDFEALSYNHKLRRKLRRAIDNAEISKETLVRQRAIDYYKEKRLEVPVLLLTPPKPLNIKGQRILDNGMFETAKQERVRARMELAEFNTQMRVLRKQAKDAAIHAGLRKHAELTGKIPPSDPSARQNQEQILAQANATPLTLREPESSLKRSRPEIDDSSDSDSDVKSDEPESNSKRSRPESDDSSNSDSDAKSDEPSDEPSDVSSMSDDSSKSEPPSSDDEAPVKKRPKLQNGDTNPDKKQSESTNSDRQAMIDAESRFQENLKNRKDKKLANGTSSLREVDANVQDRKRGWKGKGANAAAKWNVNGLSGDKARKTKFLRLLGGEKSLSGANTGAVIDGSDSAADPSARINANLEKQYEHGMAYKKESKRKGLGS